MQHQFLYLEIFLTKENSMYSISLSKILPGLQKQIVKVGMRTTQRDAQSLQSGNTIKFYSANLCSVPDVARSEGNGVRISPANNKWVEDNQRIKKKKLHMHRNIAYLDFGQSYYSLMREQRKGRGSILYKFLVLSKQQLVLLNPYSLKK